MVLTASIAYFRHWIEIEYTQEHERRLFINLAHFPYIEINLVPQSFDKASLNKSKRMQGSEDTSLH